MSMGEDLVIERVVTQHSEDASFLWLLRDRAGRLDVASGRLACAAVLPGVEALINPRPARYAPR